MPFQTNTLESQIIAIVEVGSYRIKVCVCEFKNDKVNLLAYSEKRQSTSYFVNWECKNLEMLAMGIKDALGKTEKTYDISIENIVINFPFGELFFFNNKLSYKRENERHLITKEELQKILKKTEKLILQKCFKHIEKKTGFIESDLKLIISSIIGMKIDQNPYERIVWETWQDLSISIVNTFIPIDKSNNIKYLWEIVDKNITKIIPTEFALKNLFEEKDIVIIHLWAIYTTITIKSKWKITGITKIPIGVNDLSQMISSEHKQTANEILKNIDTGTYTEKEQDFLDIWKQWLMVWMKEILWDDVCPKNFHIMSDVSVSFVEKSVWLIEFSKYGVKLVKKIHFIEIDAPNIESQIENSDDFDISPEIAAMILELKNLIKKEKSLLVKSLKKAVLELWYTD